MLCGTRAKGNKIVCHIVNSIGKWGKGFVLAVSNRWPVTRNRYLKWYNDRIEDENAFVLGNVQFVQVEPWIHIVNMIGQQGIGTGSKGPPIRYEAIKSCLEKVAMKAKELNASIHMPRIGCGLAGGDWSKIEEIIKEIFENTSIEIFVYDKD
ncbi:MAG: macro domain-containing protein [Chloroflexi bacterium]|nr:macro domain-containing protein [Chloroflexota bacterium]